jgi:branched-chain amino acid transport system ATP-binding protein
MSVPTGARSDYILRVSCVSREFGGLAALAAVDLDVAAGSRLAIVGPNGAGKSTLVGVISGFVRPTSGTVHFRGADITRMPPHRRAQAGLARTFQTPRPFASLAVEESLRLVRCRRSANPLNLRDVVELADLTPVLGRDCGSLTLGELRRVEIARAILLDPVLLMLDEPAAGLSDVEIKRLAEMLIRLSELTSTAILFIEHHLSLVRTLAQEIVVLDQGHRIASGFPQEVFRRADVREAYFGRQ